MQEYPEIIKAVKAEAIRHELDYDNLSNDMIYQTSPYSPLYISYAHLTPDADQELIITYDLKENKVIDSVVQDYQGEIPK